MRTFAILLLCLVYFPTPASGAFCPHAVGLTDAAMSGWQVPGLAVGVVKDGKVLSVRRHGVRDAASGAPVTARTMFALGSITKSLTGLALATAEIENRLSLDAPVRRTLPYFPPAITLRQLLSHSAGWPRHDALWYLDAFGRDGIVRRLARLPLFAEPGQAFQYNNVTYAAAGRVLEAATRTPWETWVRTRILLPAGMTDAVTSVNGFLGKAERAKGYFPGDAGRVALPLRDTDPVAPAGGLYAHLDDMLKYVGLIANSGKLGGSRVVPAKAMEAILRPAADAGRRDYGLGLNLTTWRGHRLAYHPGVIDGFAARLSILPDRRAGVIVLSNMSGRTPVAQIVSRTVLDCLVGQPEATDWLAHFGRRRPPPEPTPALLPPVPSERAPETYAGTYAHPAYGALTVEPAADGRRLVGRFHARLFHLDHAGGDRWRLAETRWPLREGLVFSFSDFRHGRFSVIRAPLADGPTYRHNAGPLSFVRETLP